MSGRRVSPPRRLSGAENSGSALTPACPRFAQGLQALEGLWGRLRAWAAVAWVARLPEGLQRGVEQGMQASLLRLLERKFGPLPDEVDLDGLGGGARHGVRHPGASMQVDPYVIE